jgi:hypothetical protein
VKERLSQNSQGVYQIGEVYARSVVVVTASGGSSIP